MPVVAIDARGAGPQASLLVRELRRFEGLQVPMWRAWSRVVAPHAVHALGGRLPRALPCPGVVTYTTATDRRALREASLVLCPSQAAMARAAERQGADPARLRVVPHGTPRLPRGVLPAPGAPRALAVGGDAAVVRRAWARVCPEVDLDVADGIVDARQAGGAALFVDLREDVLFGGVALAALSRGVPVVALAGGAAAEAAGDAGVVVDAVADEEALAAAFGRALADAQALAQAGRERAALFTWSGTAEATVMAYRELWTEH